MPRKVEYHQTTKDNVYIRTTVAYSLGGYDRFNNYIKRGYYLYVQPVEMVVHEYERNRYATESMALFVGVKALLKEVKRQSNKAYDEACLIAQDCERKYIDYVCDKYRYTLA